MRSLLQFTLDLLDSSLGDDPLPVPEPWPAPVLRPVTALDLPAYIHPRATREIRFGEVRVAYEFSRGQRRTIGFMVGADGLSVRAPRGVALRDVDTALQEKSGWILRKLDEMRQRHRRIEAARIVWRDGATLPFLGESLRLRLDPTAADAGKGVGVVLDPEGAVGETGEAGALRCLRIGLAPGAAEDRVRLAVEAWLKRQARCVFSERLSLFAPRLGVQWTALALSNAATRWGSASADGRIRLNWRLVHLRLALIDYVVAHELAHLRVMDHSPRFWATLATVVPDHQALRRQLKDDAVPRS